MAIIRGTTPTIEIKFTSTAPSTLTQAVLTVGTLTKELDTAEISGMSLKWTLTQEETLALTSGEILCIICTWLTRDGIRGQSKTATSAVADTPVNEVMQ